MWLNDTFYGIGDSTVGVGKFLWAIVITKSLSTAVWQQFAVQRFGGNRLCSFTAADSSSTISNVKKLNKKFKQSLRDARKPVAFPVK